MNRLIFCQYTGRCEVLIDYTKLGGDNIKYNVNKAISNLLHVNIDVDIIIVIAEFPVYGIKCISKLQPIFANMIFLTKLDIIGFSRRLNIKEGISNELHQDIPEFTGYIRFSGKQLF